MAKYDGKKKVTKGDCIKVEIATFNRKHIDAIYIDILATLEYFDDYDAVTDIKETTNTKFKEWLNDQDMWSRKNHITLWECPDKGLTTSYKGIARSINVQYYLMRDKVTDWKDTLNNIQPLVDILTTSIRRTCEDNGLSFRKWKTKVLETKQTVQSNSEPTNQSLSE